MSRQRLSETVSTKINKRRTYTLYGYTFLKFNAAYSAKGFTYA